IQGQPLEILALLLERPGQLITREELQQKLWTSDTFVDFETGLNAAVRRLREALNDSPDKPQYVETLARRGYRFIAPVTVNGTTAPEAVKVTENRSTTPAESAARTRASILLLLGAAMVVFAGLWVFKRRDKPTLPPQGSLTRITF